MKVGQEPEDDDLERANCPKGGTLGHFSCGVCEEHGLPYFICNACLDKRLTVWRENESERI
jgi:hypothetical protein